MFYIHSDIDVSFVFARVTKNCEAEIVKQNKNKKKRTQNKT